MNTSYRCTTRRIQQQSGDEPQESEVCTRPYYKRWMNTNIISQDTSIYTYPRWTQRTHNRQGDGNMVGSEPQAFEHRLTYRMRYTSRTALQAARPMKVPRIPWVCGLFSVWYATPPLTIDRPPSQEPGFVVLSKGYPSVGHCTHPKVYRMELMEVQDSNHNQAALSHHLQLLRDYLPPSSSGPPLPHHPPTAGDKETMIMVALNKVWIRVEVPNRSVSAWIYPRRKRKTSSSLLPEYRSHVRRWVEIW